MKLTLEMTDETVSSLRDVLKVSVEDIRVVCVQPLQLKHSKLDYASRIISARKLLGLSNDFREATE